MEDDFKIRFETWIPAYLCVNFFSLMFYSVYYYWEDPFRAIQSTPQIGQVLPCLILYFMALNKSSRQLYRSVYNFSGDYIYKHSDITPRSYRICDKMANSLITGSIKVMALLLFAINLGIAEAIYKLSFLHEKELIIPIILPFVDPDTEFGYYMNFGNQLVICAYGAIIIPGTELLTCVLKNTVAVMAAIIENLMDEFGEALKENEQFSVKQNAMFRDLILKTLDFDKIVADISDLYYWKFFLQPGLVMYSVAVGTFLYIKANWTTGVGIALCCYLQLLILCDVGKTVDDASDEILGVFNRVPFYLMPIEKQRMLVIVVQRTQNGGKIQMGPFSELNYETASNMTKTIYSYLMLLLQTIE